ncbi:MAG: S49 family peptidase [Spirochaetia bacterium]|nr:S49 family peptidase [Spirochaetia bacterium]
MDSRAATQTVTKAASVLPRQSLDYHRHATRAILVISVFFLLSTPLPVPAQEATPITRADPVTFWDFTGNPAAQAFSGDAFSLAFRENIDLTKLDVQADDPAQNLDLGLGFGGISYNSLHGADDRGNRLATALGLGSFGAGAAVSWEEGDKLTSSDSPYDLGVLYRPFNLFSVGVTLEDASSASPAWGGGLAIRPLAAWPHRESALTLSADVLARDGSTRVQNVAARIRLGSWLGLKAWVEPESLRFGLQTHLRIGIGESELVLPDAGTMDNAAFASALRLDRPGRRTPLPFGTTLLVIDDAGMVPSSPPMLYMPGFRERIWLGSLVEALDRAAGDPQVAGIVIYYPPMAASIADAQALHRSLSAFKASGKPVFAYARVLGKNDYIYTAASADYLALDPNGQLGLVDLGSFDLYFRGFFEKLGIRMYNLQSHDTKTAFNNFTEYGITDAERTMKERYVGGLAAQSYAALEQARGERLAKDAASLIGAGPYLIPSQAIEAGLVDALAYRDEFDKTVEKRMGRVSRLDIRDYMRDTTTSWGPPPGTRTVALLYLQGTILDDEGIAGRSIGEATARTLAALREDNSVDGILMRVDSGGGSALMSDLIAREVALTVEAGKPVYVSMGGYAASGGYYISAPATRIYAEEGTITGSIGVTGLWPDASGLLDKLAIGSDTVVAGDSANFGNILLPRREEDAAVLAASIAHIYERFIAVVARGRSMDTKKADELGRGQVWLGSEAVANGLADETGGLEAAKAGMMNELGGPVHFVELLPGQNPVSLMTSMMDSALQLAAAGTLRTEAAGGPVTAAHRQPGIPAAFKQALDLAAELEELGSGPQTLFADYLFRNRAVR